MATLMLGALGTLVGGPIGGAIGALAGRQVDALLFKPSGREGPRLKDLALSTSSYGSAIPMVFGRARVGGSIIWATDLVENRSTSGGGKGRPKVTSFAYSSSFAVAVSSRPIRRIGRIWADGQLVRGEAGDLKVGGSLRVYTGEADQPVDPLLAAASPGGLSPAYRGCAYVVFEDLQLADFGNRLPALSFEVFADDDPLDLASLMEGVVDPGRIEAALPGLEGFELTGGTLRDVLGLLDTFYPVVVDVSDTGLVIRSQGHAGPAAPVANGLLASVGDDDFGRQTGQLLLRDDAARPVPGAVRYYDPARDYQPGVQRSEGGASQDSGTLEFPAVLASQTARGLLQAAYVRQSSGTTQLRIRTAAIDPAIAPGKTVTLSETVGTWVVADWEWRDSGIELSLERVRHFGANLASADPGQFPAPPDLSDSPSALFAFELPLDGMATPDSPRRYLAASAQSAGWRGAQLLADDGAGFTPVGSSGRIRATVGQTLTALPASQGFVLERLASVEIALLGTDMMLAASSERGLAQGANRMLLGDEVIQFLTPVPLGEGRWRLDGLLRGRGGTEAAAQRGHVPGTTAILLDDALMPIDGLAPAALGAESFAAIGLADPEPSEATLTNRGASLRPLHPVHPRLRMLPDGTLQLSWTRRARGAWLWNDGVDVPLVEQAERYLVGAGPTDHPVRVWETGTAGIDLGPSDYQDLAPGTTVWVQQIGSHALSDPVLLHILP
ncbi:MAG: hypothetical protein KJZ64_06285 [Sphingomonadaceae bacterium]|nr:hypothetical protein [Sphingomonadaceae bacterium]